MKPKRRKRGPSGATAGRFAKANLAALKQRDPQLARAVALPPQGTHLRLEVVGGEPRDLHMTLAPGREVAWYGEDPATVVELLRGSTDFRGASVAFVMGLGLGEELMSLARDPDLRLNHIIVIEPDLDVVRLAMRSTSLVKALRMPGVRILGGLPIPQLTAALYDMWSDPRLLRLCKTVVIATPSGGRRFQAAYHEQAAGAVEGSISRCLLGVGDSTIDTFLGLEHTLRNLPSVVTSPGLAPLEGSFRGRPVVIASAGPSLTKQFDELRRIQDDVLIICPDTSLGPLIDAGIEPHLVASRERVPRTARHFRDIGIKSARLAGLALLHPDCYQAFGGEILPIFRTVAHFPWLWPGRPGLAFGGASGNMAYALATFLGCDPILFIGQDLAFGEDGSTHTSDTAFGDRQERYKHEPRLKVPGNLGQPVTTTALWARFIKEFENAIVRNPGRTLNCTEGGAFIRGAEPVKFVDALSSLPARGGAPRPADLLDGRLGSLSPAAASAEARRLHSLLARARQDLNAICVKCDEGEAAAGALLGQAVPASVRDMPTDVATMLGQPPLSELNKRRTSMSRMAGFEIVVMPSAQPFLLPWEVDLFALQRGPVDSVGLYERMLPELKRWFEGVRSLTRRTVDLLVWGEHALADNYPELPATDRPLPAETMFEAWEKANPRMQDRWSKPL